MTLPASGQLDMYTINSEFGRGYDLNAYRNTIWYTDAGGSGYFSAGQIAMSEFWGKRVSSPNPVYISASNYSTAASASLETLTWSHTVPAGTNLLVVTQAWGDAGAPTTTNYATFNGVTLTKLSNVVYNGSNMVAIHYMWNPPIGTYTLTSKYSTGAHTIDRFAASHAVNLGNMTGTVVTTGGNWGTSGDRSLSLALSKASIIIDASWGYNSGSTIPALGVSAPAGTVEVATSANSSNSLGKRFSTFVTPVQTGTPTVTNTYGVGNIEIMNLGGFG